MREESADAAITELEGALSREEARGSSTDPHARREMLLSLLTCLADAATGEARAELRELATSAGATLDDEAAEEPSAEEASAEEESEAELAERERALWGAPMTAWRLGDEARAASGHERAALLDRTLDAFAEIARTPVSPGNDEGPFWAIADLLDEPQVRRGLAIVDRMDAADWKGDLGASRATLLARLAWLGHIDEAEALIARIDPEAPLGSYWRGRAWGRVTGARLVADPMLAFEALAERAWGDPAFDDPECRHRFFYAMVQTFADRPPPRAENAEEWVAMASSFEASARGAAIGGLIEHVFDALAAGRWIAVVLATCEGATRVDRLVDIAKALRERGREEEPALEPLFAYLASRACAVSPWILRDVAELGVRIAPDARLSLWRAFLEDAESSGVLRALATLRAHADLAALLEWVAGPTALVRVGRTIARALIASGGLASP